MTFKQLLKHHTWSSVLPIFFNMYPKAETSIEEYKVVFEKLALMKPEKTDISIVITKQKEDDETYIDVSGLHNNPTNEEEKYKQGLELTPWRKWLGMEISKNSLSEFTELEIIVHCLYEMTFVGFSEENIQETCNEINQNDNSMTEEEIQENGISVEELLKDLKEDDC